MSIERARAYLQQYGIEDRIRELPTSSATVALAAQALGCAPQRIAKTLSFLVEENKKRKAKPAQATEESRHGISSQLSQWPIQIKLAPVQAPYFENADLLIAADCTAYAYGNFHQDFIKGRITLIGCPKLDAVDYTEKLTEILCRNTIRSVTIVRMEVPCCGGIEYAAVTALKNSGKMIPKQVITVSTQGQILDK